MKDELGDKKMFLKVYLVAILIAVIVGTGLEVYLANRFDHHTR